MTSSYWAEVGPLVIEILSPGPPGIGLPSGINSAGKFVRKVGTIPYEYELVDRATDEQLRDRSTHTGTQGVETINGLADVAVSGNYTDLIGVPILFNPASPGVIGDSTPSRAFFTNVTIAGAYTSDVPVYEELYNYAITDSEDRVAVGLLKDGTFFANKIAYMSIAGNAATATKATTANSATTTPRNDFTTGESQLGDSSYDELYNYAIIDSEGRAAIGLLKNGTFFANRPASMSITGNAVTATTATSVTTAPRNDFTTGESQFGDSSYADNVSYAIQDASGRIAFGVKNSGKLLIGAVQNFVTFSQVHGTAGLYSVSLDQYGRAQIVLGGNSGVSSLTTTGNNWNPSVTTETPQRVAFLSDRSEGVNYWVMNSDGSRQALAIPDSSVTFWGDSMTQRLQNHAHLPALLPGRTLTYNALGGTSIEHIIARQGGENATCVIPSGSIPASGSVALTNVWPSLGYHAGTMTVGATYSYLVTIAGVQGTLLSTTNSSSQADYTFTRTNSGTAVSVSGPQAITIISDLVNSMGYGKANTAIFWVGTNSVSNLPSATYTATTGTGLYYKSPATTYDPANSSAVQARTEALAAAMIGRVENLDRHILIVGPFLGSGQVWATSTEKIAIVAAFSNFTKYWYDLRSDFVATCKTWLQTNYPSVYTGWSASDDTHVANGASPPILREDSIHLNTYGSQLVSQLIATRLTSKQW